MEQKSKDKRLIVDVDGTITIDDRSLSYELKEANQQVIKRLREYRSMGFQIILLTARNMRTYDGNVGKINVHTLPILLDWLQENDVPYDEVIVGKPWCGKDGFYVDDKAVRPDEFVNMTYQEIREIIS
jgi:capsule biosynthesis phosphatase